MIKFYKRYKVWFQIVFFMFLLGATVWIIRAKNAPFNLNQGKIFGTSYNIKYQSPTDFHPEIKAELKRVDEALSLFNPESWLSRYNRGERPAANPMADEVITLAMRVSKETNGAFDITVAPLVNAWGFGTKTGQWPTDNQVDSLRQFVGFQRYLEGETVTLDCGAVAKGYGVDRAAKVLDDHGVENYMVEIGGEVVVKGKNPDGNPWVIGVAKPTATAEEMVQLNLADCALATSGNYLNFHTDSLGNKVAHTIDPRLGRPVQHSLLSATVQAKTCAEADAYATAFMVMGYDAALEFLKRHPELHVYFIYSKPDGSYGIYNTIL